MMSEHDRYRAVNEPNEWSLCDSRYGGSKPHSMNLNQQYHPSDISIGYASTAEEDDEHIARMFEHVDKRLRRLFPDE